MGNWLRGKIGTAMMYFSFALRKNPARFLFNDGLFNSLNIQNDEEMEYFNKDWKGHVWDIGASVGKYTNTLAKANPDHMVYAFEPNMNSLYYLAYKTRNCPNVVIVPNALTLDGKPLKGNFDPDFHRPPTGPDVATISLAQAIEQFGTPAFLKMDIEGGEYILLEDEPEALRQTNMLVEWHPHEWDGKPIPEFTHWSKKMVMSNLAFLEPVSKSND